MPAAKRTESLAIVDPNLADISNMAFMGTLVTRGSGIGVVVSTGMNTEVGQIAGLLQASEGMDTPLQRKLEQLGKILRAKVHAFDSFAGIGDAFASNPGVSRRAPHLRDAR